MLEILNTYSIMLTGFYLKSSCYDSIFYVTDNSPAKLWPSSGENLNLADSHSEMIE